MPIVTETLQEFGDRHGGYSQRLITDDSRFLFPDGASCSHDSFMRWEPQDERSQRVMQRKYLVLKLGIAEKEFHRARAAFSEQAALATRYPNLPPPFDAPETLLVLKTDVEACRAALQEFDARIADAPEAKHQHERAEADAKEQEHNRELLQRINSINL